MFGPDVSCVGVMGMVSTPILGRGFTVLRTQFGCGRCFCVKKTESVIIVCIFSIKFM